MLHVCYSVRAVIVFSFAAPILRMQSASAMTSIKLEAEVNRLKTEYDFTKYDFVYPAMKSKRIRRAVIPLLESASQAQPYSPWKNWMECEASECGMEGKQIRIRKCNGKQPTTAPSLTCNYGNLIDMRPCVGPPCEVGPEGTKKSWSGWSEWSQCSITCGKGGQQSRIRSCTIVVENRTEIISPKKCSGRAEDIRLCQFSVSCVRLDSWSQWSACSNGCGEAIYRSRRCTVERYFSLRLASKSIANAAQKNSASIEIHNADFTKVETVFKGILVLNEDEENVFIINAEIPKMQENFFPNQFVPTFHKSPDNDTAHVENCGIEDGPVEEVSVCNPNKCPSHWDAWEPWTTCLAACGVGIVRRSRECILNAKSIECPGRAFGYSLCYSPPCWSQWMNVGNCSTTCGSGHQLRKRECLTSEHSPYQSCPGLSHNTTECNLQECAVTEDP